MPLVHLLPEYGGKEAFIGVCWFIRIAGRFYEQIYPKLQMLVIKRVLKENERMPSVSEIWPWNYPNQSEHLLSRRGVIRLLPPPLSVPPIKSRSLGTIL